MGMFTFRLPRRPFPSGSRNQGGAASYRNILDKYPFLMFGLPFVATMVAGSFFLTPATAVRYEKFDRKTHILDRDNALGVDKLRAAGKARNRGSKGDIREEYYRLAGKLNSPKLDDYEPIRVKRLPGEPDGTFD